MIPTIIRVSKESFKLVLTILLKDNKREASTVDLTELDGLIITDNTVASSCARPSWPGCSIFGEWPEGMLRSLKSLCSHKEQQLPQFSSSYSNFITPGATGMEFGHSSPPVFSQPPVFPQPPMRGPGRPAGVRLVHEGPLTTPAPKTMMSAAPPMTSASGIFSVTCVPVPWPTFSGRHHVRGAGKYQETPLRGVLLDRQHSPTSPLDIIEPLDSTLMPPPFSGVTSGVPSSGKLKGDPALAAGLPVLPAPGSCAKSGNAPNLPLRPLVSAFAVAASRPPSFSETKDEEDPAQEEEVFRPVKSYEWVVDKLLDMSVASLLTSSPRQLSSQLNHQHQQAIFGRVAVPDKLTPKFDGR